MKLVAEYVSPGHPDRICDAIVNNIVKYVVSKDSDALCGLECAVHTNKVFVDGRIAAGKKTPVIDKKTIRRIVRETYKEAGYGPLYPKDKNSFGWHPYPNNLHIYLDVCIETLSDDERDLRQYSDDQNVVNGYAINNEKTDYLPVAHYIAHVIGTSFINRCRRDLGPDFKVLVQIDDEQGQLCWDRLTISIQHSRRENFAEAFRDCLYIISSELKKFKNTKLDSLSTIDPNKFYLNGAGDFIQGGPEGDNGLSGKKLCIDFYGPQIPIGGGAIYGKDPHKIDVCGAYRARELAVNLVKQYGYHSVFTTLAWSPGEESPYIIEAYEIDEFGTKMKIDDALLPPRDYFFIDCINNDLGLPQGKIGSIRDIK